MADLNYDFGGRVALVTGASRGIGYEVALDLARRGVRVIAVARGQSGLEALDDAVREAGGEKPVLAVIDLADRVAVNGMIAGVRERFGCLDILVGNAGILGELVPVSQISGELMERVFVVNFLANQWLIAGFDDLLRASDGGRAMFVTSGVAVAGRGFWGCYGASKAALENMVMAWSGEVGGSVCVNLFNPGGTRTAMRALAFPGEDPGSLPTAREVGLRLVECLASDAHGRIFSFSSVQSSAC